MKIRGALQRFDNHIRYAYVPKIVDFFVKAAAWQAKRNLKCYKEPIKILVDNSVVANAITHETAWINTGVSKWGRHDVETGYAARVQVHEPDGKSELYQNITYMPAISYLVKKGLIDLLYSQELEIERDRQPVGRYAGYGYFDYGLFRGIKFSDIDTGKENYPRNLSGFAFSSADQQRDRLKNFKDPLYLSLKKILGEKNSQDAWHIYTAEKFGAYCFLTLDFRLLRAVKNFRKTDTISMLKTKILSPKDFGIEFAILPIPPGLFAYHDATFPVRSDLHMPRGRRRPRSQYRKN